MNPHIGDEAELFALGVLESERATAIERHLDDCAACSLRVGRSERVVVALGSVSWDPLSSPNATGWPRRVVRTPLPWIALAATLLLVAVLGGMFGRDRALLSAIVASDETALATIATSHFAHASFKSQRTDAPPAKVLYGRSADWLYVIVDAARNDLRVRATTHDGTVDLGRLQTRGTTSVLFARPQRRIDALVLIDSTGHSVSGVSLVYATGRAP